MAAASPFHSDGELIAALRNAECERQVAQDEAAKLRTEKMVLEQRIEKLEAAAPVMLTALAFIAHEATSQAMREAGLWYSERTADALEVWLDADRKSFNRAIATAKAAGHG